MIVAKANELIRARNSLLQGGECQKDLQSVEQLLNTPFSTKIPFESSSDEDENFIFDNVSDGVRQLTVLLGFSEISDGAVDILRAHSIALFERLLSQYRISELRRKESLQTAFRSSIQHVLCTNNISDPGMLQQHLLRRIYPRIRSVAHWWDSYIKSPEERENMIRKLMTEKDEC